ncbi:MAG TPA: nuclear transport factor 2 family protein [Candidatus Limnocylindrales bacterium]|nr:nuclear transport factor 2 family protein [Candidatus Limnocylindrales bacterium]
MAADGDAHGFDRTARAAHRRFVAGLRRQDAATATSGYADDARLVAPSADLIEGRTGIESFWRAGLDAGIRAVERVPVRLEGHGAIAFEIGRYAIRLRPAGGGSVVDRGSYLLVHERNAAGAWQWALEMFTPDGAPQVASGAAAVQGQEVGDRH